MRARHTATAVLLGALAVAGIWEGAARALHNPKLLPPLAVVATDSVASFSQFESTGEQSWFRGVTVLLRHTAVTLFRIIVGGTLGVCAGVGCGLLLFYSGWFRGVGDFTIGTLRAVPLLVLIPLFVFWFGGAEVGIHIWIFFACFVMMATSAMDAALNVPPNITYLARLFGASRGHLLFRVVLPAITPQLLTTYRAATGLSWSFALGAEYLVARSGLGFLASYSYMYADMGKLLVLTLYYGSLGLATHLITGLLPAVVCPWHESASDNT